MQRLKQAGFNLIEVMIALVVLSIGLLGLAALQVTSLQQNQSAYLRSQATLFAYDITDRMRANIDEVGNGSYFVTSGATNTACINYSASAAGCTASVMASHDVAEWQAAIAAELPDGSGRVCRSDLNGDAVGAPNCEADNSNNPIVVYVWWNDEKNGAGATTQFTVSVNP